MMSLQDMVGRLHRCEAGATLTEFILTLPIFILIFVGIIHLGEFESRAGKAWANAYADTWERVIPGTYPPTVAPDQSQVHSSPSLAGTHAGQQLTTRGPHNRIARTAQEARAAESATYVGMRTGGHWGESFQRTRPAASYMEFDVVEGHVTANPSGIIGNSDYARDLLNDGGGSSVYSSTGSGALARLGSMVSGNALRPVVGAGMRYGTVTGRFEAQHTVIGVTMDMHAYFNVLVAPVPTGQGTAAAVTRMTMENHAPYREMLGISDNQPLTEETISVPDPF